MYKFRKSIGGWSIDKKINGHWVFYIKLPTKKACIEWINNKNATQLSITI